MYLYFIRAGKKGPIKIGIAADVDKRLSELQIGNPYRLEVLAALLCETRKHAEFMESRMHKHFKKQHIRGEWFYGHIEFKKAADRIQQELTAHKFR